MSKYERVVDRAEYPVGNVQNYYGGIMVKRVDDKHFWSITDWNGNRWEPVSKELFIALLEESQ